RDPELPLQRRQHHRHRVHPRATDRHQRERDPKAGPGVRGIGAVRCLERFHVGRAVRGVNASNPAVTASSSRAEKASDQWMPMKPPIIPTVMPEKARMPRANRIPVRSRHARLLRHHGRDYRGLHRHPLVARLFRSAAARGDRRIARVHAAHSAPDMKTLQTSHGADSPYAWTRLWVALALVTIGGAGMYSMAVVLPPLQGEFGIARADASLPFTLTMIGFGLGSVLMGRLSDRFGVIVPVLVGSVSLGFGFIAARFSQNLLQFTAIHGLLIGVGTSG